MDCAYGMLRYASQELYAKAYAAIKSWQTPKRISRNVGIQAFCNIFVFTDYTNVQIEAALSSFVQK